MPYKILHVIDSLGLGGTELQLVLNVGEMPGERFENHVCYLHAPNDLEPALDRKGVPVYRLSLTGRYQWVQGVTRLRRLVKSLGIDLIHTNLFEADIIGGLAGRTMRRPVVSTITNICFDPELLVDNPHMSAFKMVAPRLIRSAVARTCNAHLVSVSQTVARSAARRLGVPPSKTSVIHRSLASRWLTPNDDARLRHVQAELSLSDSYPVILNVGRLVPQKGQRYLIQAMATVARRFPRAKLVIAGDGFLKPSLSGLRDRMGLQGHVFFLGQRDDIKELIGVSDIFAFPSLFEGCPNSLIEAMAMGKPCVASRIGPNEEVIEDGVTGLLVPSQSREALAEGIIRLALNQEEASLLGQRAKEMARERFTVALAVRKLEAVYDRVIQDYYGPRRENRASPSSPVQAGK